MRYATTFGLMSILAAVSCKKNSTVPLSPVAFNVVNVMPASNPIIPVFGTKDPIEYFANANQIGYPGSYEYSPSSGSTSLYVIQADDTTLSDKKQKMLNGQFSLIPGGIYSLFLAGDTTSPDTLFLRDNITNYTDSSAGVRFINLSTGSLPMSVTILGNPASETEFANIGYKGVSGFRKYPAGPSAGGYYIFTVRDQASGDSLTSLLWFYTVGRNSTLVMSGTENPFNSNLLQVYQMNNY